ncbi:MAG: fused MFS/spermidine synthase, partial [Verrucomicrobia bacterium]|nr:fused MFS/spermidine synthase [Verrucomicrobiota bacterium]
MSKPRGKKALAQKTPGSGSSDGLFWVVTLCFFLSGAAGLIYQMVWMRHLATVFGTSELAIVAVLVAYMGGLAVGAWAASKFLKNVQRPIFVYAVLEIFIAGSAVVVPLLIWLVDRLYTGMLGGQAMLPEDGGITEAVANLLLGCVVLIVPTACMGATLPILAKGVVHRSEEIGRRIGWLYALNTFGAVAGTVSAAFFLIPHLGLWRTSFVGFGLNCFVAVLGWSVAKRGGESVAEAVDSTVQAPKSGSAFPNIILAVMFISGGVAFAYEVLWARLLAHVLGGSLYAFATMLAAFLSGIAIGGLLGAKIARDQRRSCYWLAGVEIGTGTLTAIIFTIVTSDQFGGGTPTLAGQAFLCALILMPATLCLGATFPLAVRTLTDDPADAGGSAARVYSWNTIGAIAGAVGAGYFLIPAIGYSATFKWAISVNVLLGAVVLIAVRPVPRPFAIGAFVIFVASLTFYNPKPPLRLLTMSPFSKEQASPGTNPELMHHAVGRSATVAVLRRQGSFVIRTNGLPEAEIFPKGAASLSYTHIRWLPALPKVLRPETDSLLVVGFGGGALLENVPSGYQSVDVVELEAEVIEANRAIADLRASDPLQDDRINIVINDARGAMKLTAKQYGAIVSQPSHPWTAGASHLYTEEFVRLAGERLKPGGIFVQWLGSQFVDERLMRSFCATILQVFPHVQLYLIGDNFLFVGSDASLDEKLFSDESDGKSVFHLSDYPKLSYMEDLLAVLLCDEAGCRKLAAGHDPITDDRNLMATGHRPG